MDLDPEISRDTLFNGEISCLQFRDGYRFSIDAVLLAHFIEVGRDTRLLDLGTGCGILPLIINHRYGNLLQWICGVEIQPSLCRLAEKNYTLNGINEKGWIFNEDIGKLPAIISAESFDQVVCNPPFYLSGAGRKNVGEQARLARHQISAGIDEFLRAAAYALRNRGTASFIYPADQLVPFVFAAQQVRLNVKKIRFVYSYPGSQVPARLVLLQCIKNGGSGTIIKAPLYIYSEKEGCYTKEVSRFYKSNKDIGNIS
jgi:tRNA1Val (adenine37-N6)-methyltransferase